MRPLLRLDFTMGLKSDAARDETGNVSQEPYPAAIMMKDQSQRPMTIGTIPEMVTPAASHSLDAMHYLYKINNALRTA